MTTRTASIRSAVPRLVSVVLLASSLAWTACGAADGKSADLKGQTASPPPLSVRPVAATQEAVVRFIRATGTLTAEEHADVAAETGGRVVATPIERGTAVASGAELIRLSSVETDAQLREAEANAGQIEARLGLVGGSSFEVDTVPEVQNAKAG